MAYMCTKLDDGGFSHCKLQRYDWWPKIYNWSHDDGLQTDQLRDSLSPQG